MVKIVIVLSDFHQARYLRESNRHLISGSFIPSENLYSASKGAVHKVRHAGGGRGSEKV